MPALRSLFHIFIILAIGLGGGATSAWYALQNAHGFGAITLGQWTAWPLAGNVDADPYTEAKVARDGSVPLGAAEGLAFEAQVDSEGNLLLRQCRYQMLGSTPSARLWTLSAYGLNNAVIPPVEGGINTVFSREILRAANGSFRINISSSALPGNWLSTSGSGPMKLVLRLYDTPITGNAGLADPDMPVVVKTECIQ